MSFLTCTVAVVQIMVIDEQLPVSVAVCDQRCKAKDDSLAIHFSLSFPSWVLPLGSSQDRATTF